MLTVAHDIAFESAQVSVIYSKVPPVVLIYYICLWFFVL